MIISTLFSIVSTGLNLLVDGGVETVGWIALPAIVFGLKALNGIDTVGGIAVPAISFVVQSIKALFSC